MRMIILSRRIVQGNHEFVNNVRNNPHKKHIQDFILENEKTRKKIKTNRRRSNRCFSRLCLRFPTDVATVNK